MKATERYIGLILERSQVTAVEIAHSPKGYTLTAAGSYLSGLNFDNQELFSQPGSMQRERLLAQELSSFFKKIGCGSKQYSFGLNSKMVMMQTIPLDPALAGSDIDQHARWEVTQYFTDNQPQAFSISTAILDAGDEGGAAQALIVSVRKTFVNFLTKVSAMVGGTLHVVDIDHFAAENALLKNYPAAASGRVLLVGVDEDSLDASLLVDGETKHVVTLEWNEEHDMAGLASYGRERKAETAYFHGRVVSETMVDAARNALALPVEILDPFTVVSLPRSLKNYDEVTGHRPSFASAVGLALRAE